MTWNYRLVLISEGWVEVKEVYYNADGIPTAYSDATVGGEDPKDLRRSLDLMLGAWSRPVLTLDDCGQLA